MASVPSPPFNLSTAYQVFSPGASSGSLGDLRRAPGGIVPNIAGNSGVPQSAPLSMSQLAGATNYQNISLGGSSSASGEVSQPSGSAPATQPVGSNTATITVSGGNPGPTVSWSHLSGDASIAVNSPSSLSTTFSATVNKNSTKSAVKRCTVSDGVSSATRDVSVNLTYSTF